LRGQVTGIRSQLRLTRIAKAIFFLIRHGFTQMRTEEGRIFYTIANTCYVKIRPFSVPIRENLCPIVRRHRLWPTEATLAGNSHPTPDT